MTLLKRLNLTHPLPWAIIYFIALGIISVILGQDVSWDLRNYHFYNPYMLLTGRFKYDVLPAQIQTFFNPLMDVPFFVAIYYLKLPPVVVGFFLGGFHGLNQWLVHLITYHSFDKVGERYKITLSVAAAITSIVGAAFLSELGTSIGDSTSSVFVLAGLFLIIACLGRNQPVKVKTIIFAGLLLGLATGLKLTTALYSISLIVAISFLTNTIREKLRNLLSLILSMAVGFSLTMGYWIILMWTNFANPLFPFFNKIFQSPYIETDVNLQDLRFLPRDIWQWLFYPFYFAQEQTLVAELKFKEPRFAITYILIVALLGFMLYRYATKKLTFPVNKLIHTSVLGFLLPFYITAYCIWIVKFSIYRYLIVLELITPILIILIVAYLYPKKTPVFLVTIGIFVLILATVKPLDWWRIPWSDNYFSIDRQALVQYQDDVIVLWGGEPVGYVVPYFPSNTRFLRITGNFGLSPHTRMSKIAQEIIDKTPESSLYLLEVDFELKESDREKSKQAALELRNLVIDRNNCQPFITAIEKYSICKLIKTSP
ncbi:glycosyltransferase 87 family protein [Microcystis aeruginosa CS-564/01]|uniref:glycosyltransferase 87 family protein n=1 Tax=Microcystis aeruginosa TaxID=1126 RepID=UPI00232C8A8C|nr:glycosyltransferase 87 family protein [Microcystis aeruginosa]MDB9424140.1 glycosyltransferase 87 family protein [Microcystis aeruginosa CS-564/01]